MPNLMPLLMKSLTVLAVMFGVVQLARNFDQVAKIYSGRGL